MTVNAHERWYTKTTREWPLVAFTAIATAFFTAFFTYCATIRVENAKVRSDNVTKITNEFQTKFASVVTDVQKFNVNSVEQQQISEPDRAQLESDILLLQLTMAPATGKWPDDVIEKANAFFKDLGDLERAIKAATTFSALEIADPIVHKLVVDDMVIMRTMQSRGHIDRANPTSLGRRTTGHE